MAKILILGNTDTFAFIKVISEGNGTVSLALADLCKKPGEDGKVFQTTWDHKPLMATIRSVQWSGEEGGMLRVKRGDERVMSLQSAPQGLMQFDGQQMSSDSQGAEKDFNFEFSGAPMEAWFVVRKVNYRSIGDEYAEYGAYEDEEKLGARTDINGSPDYVPLMG